MINYLEKLDQNLFLFINSFHSNFFDKIMWQISGQIIWIPYFIMIMYLIIKKYGKKTFLPLLFLPLTIISSDIISVHLFKDVFKRLRPCHNQEIANFVHIVKNHCGGEYGFVSSHSTNFFSLATFSSLLIKKNWYTYISIFIATIIAYSRIYLGVHYPGDVIGGAIVGFVIAFMFFKLYLVILKRNIHKI